MSTSAFSKSDIVFECCTLETTAAFPDLSERVIGSQQSDVVTCRDGVASHARDYFKSLFGTDMRPECLFVNLLAHWQSPAHSPRQHR